MIAADSNVIIRFLVRDDPRQTETADRLLDDLAARGESCLLVDAVLCEIEWVLETTYGASRREIGDTIERLLGNPVFVFEDRSLIQRSLDAYRRARSDFSDHLIGCRAAKLGATTTCTFDRSLRRSAWFTLLP